MPLGVTLVGALVLWQVFSRPLRQRRFDVGDLGVRALGAAAPALLVFLAVAGSALKITDDEAELLAFYDFPAEHWIPLRTTNPIESTFGTVRLRIKVTKGAGSRAAALAMVFKLVESAQTRWRAVNAPHLVALVRAGASNAVGSSNAPRLTRPESPQLIDCS